MELDGLACMAQGCIAAYKQYAEAVNGLLRCDGGGIKFASCM
jgi:hypothetical protein